MEEGKIMKYAPNRDVTIQSCVDLLDVYEPLRNSWVAMPPIDVLISATRLYKNFADQASHACCGRCTNPAIHKVYAKHWELQATKTSRLAQMFDPKVAL